MGKNTLQLNFPDCTVEGVFLIDDISIYDTSSTSLPLTCGNLQVTAPGFTTPTSMLVTPGFHLVLNACTLGIIAASGCASTCPAIDDGMYNIRYSVAPNDQVFVEYKILRIVKAMNRYHRMLCRVGLTPCLPDQDVQNELRDLDTIRNYLLSAKLTVENEHQFEDGMNQYGFAVGLMDKMSYRRKTC